MVDDHLLRESEHQGWYRIGALINSEDLHPIIGRRIHAVILEDLAYGCIASGMRHLGIRHQVCRAFEVERGELVKFELDDGKLGSARARASQCEAGTRLATIEDASAKADAWVIVARCAIHTERECTACHRGIVCV